MSYHHDIHKLKRDLIRAFATAYSLADTFDAARDDQAKHINHLHVTLLENETWLTSITDYKRVSGSGAPDAGLSGVPADSGRDDHEHHATVMTDIRAVMRRQLGEFLHLLALVDDDDNARIILSFDDGTQEETAGFIARRVHAMTGMLPRLEDSVNATAAE